MISLKKILSYIFDFPIEKRQSRFSGEVIVSFHKGQYKLSTANAIYSFGKNYTSFDIAFKTLDIQNINIENVLVLGFGLGSVVDLLEYHPAIKNITESDIDEMIVCDTIPLQQPAINCPKIRTLSLSHIISETILRVNNKESVSSMFEDQKA